jgi:hypothetical protein
MAERLANDWVYASLGVGRVCRVELRICLGELEGDWESQGSQRMTGG